MKTNKSYRKNAVFSSIFLLVVLGVLNALIFVYAGPIILLVSSAISVFYFLITIKNLVKFSKLQDDGLKSFRETIKSGANYMNINMPIPMMMVNNAAEIVWYNDEMGKMIEKSSAPVKRNVEEVLPGFDFGKILQVHSSDLEEPTQGDPYLEDKKIRVTLRGKFYEVSSSKYVKNVGEEGVLYIIYFYDLSLYKEYEDRYKDERAVVAVLELDNFDDLMNEIKEAKRPAIRAEIDSTINLWASRMNALIKKYDKAKYIVMMSHVYYRNLELKRFAILDQIRSIEVDANFPPTLSIGVCPDELTYNEQEKEAFSALEVALARGGDQAVVKRQSDYDFYGGKSKAVEKRNRVKARIIAHAFRPIIDESYNVYIMGHQYPDMDAFGAAIGVHKAARDRGKNAKIILNEPNETIKLVYDSFEDVADNYFVSSRYALDNFMPSSDLLVVVDTHRPSFTECPELLNIAERKVVIDHHRRSAEIIENTLLTYLEPYSSSACELVTEVLQYMEKKPTIDKREAEALLAGIVLDTKNFSFKTGVRTFETAAVLKRFGADTTNVKQFMQDDITSFVTRSIIVRNAKRYGDHIAISVTQENIKNPRLIAAQAADQMLSIRGINSSFVVVREDDKIYVSARSIKDVNVQVIMEKLGGGGHMRSAGTQLVDVDIRDAEKMLLEAIDDYLEGEEH